MTNKQMATITLDSDLIMESKRLNLNMSGTINMLLRDYLKPKKADIADEMKLIEIGEYSKQLGLDSNIGLDICSNIDKDVKGEWERFKQRFNIEFSLFDFIEYRNKFRERFIK